MARLCGPATQMAAWRSGQNLRFMTRLSASAWRAPADARCSGLHRSAGWLPGSRTDSGLTPTTGLSRCGNIVNTRRLGSAYEAGRAEHRVPLDDRLFVSTRAPFALVTERGWVLTRLARPVLPSE